MLKNKLLYADDYTYFSFDNMFSGNFNTFIESSPDELKMYINKGTNIECISPKYGEQSYLLGVTHSQREIPLKLVSFGVTRQELATIMSWLALGKVASLHFCFAPDWVFDVVVESITDPILYPAGENTIVASYSVVFKTIGSYRARIKTDAHWDGSITDTQEQSSYSCDNQFNIPQIKYFDTEEETKHKFIIHYLGNACSYLNVSAEMATNNIKLHISADDFNSYISAVYEPISNTENVSNDKDYKLVEYRNKTNLFFINDLLPEMAANRSILSNTEILYSYNNIYLNSPGSLIVVDNDNKESVVSEFINNTHMCFLCKPAVVERTSYDNASYGEGLYSLKVNADASFYYNNSVDKTYEKIIDKINSGYILFGYCDEITITTADANDIINLTLTEFTEVI